MDKLTHTNLKIYYTTIYHNVFNKTMVKFGLKLVYQYNYQSINDQFKTCAVKWIRDLHKKEDISQNDECKNTLSCIKKENKLRPF